MSLSGKKIGFALTISQLSDKIILGEIERIMISGTELFIILLDTPEKNEGIKSKFQSIFHFLQHVIMKRGVKNGTAPEATSLPLTLDYPFLDLLVVMPNSEHFLHLLTQIVPEEHTGIPLVLVPALENEPAPSLGYISTLMKKQGVYFVPFGPFEQKQKIKAENAFLHSRLDLLTETCAAALEGHQLKPSTWEEHFFPH